MEAVANGYKICKLTLVQAGLSDSRINIYPAEHDEEKLWLTDVKGIERWEMIQRNMSAFAEKGTRIPKPAPYHNDPKNLMTITLQEKDVPLVRLDGWVLPKPPQEPKMPDYAAIPNSMFDVGNRLGKLERTVSNIENTLSNLDKYLTSRDQPRPSNQSDDLASQAGLSFTCCNQTFKDKRGLAAHNRFKHKEG